MNQAFIGSVFWNLPYFKNDGVFGSRFYGGKDRGSIKSIKTELNKMTRLLFSKNDLHFIDYKSFLGK